MQCQDRSPTQCTGVGARQDPGTGRRAQDSSLARCPFERDKSQSRMQEREATGHVDSWAWAPSMALSEGGLTSVSSASSSWLRNQRQSWGKG